MDWQQSANRGPGDEPGSAVPADGSVARDPRLSGFARGGDWDTCPPSAALALILEGLAGPGQRCPGAEHDELLGLLRQCQAQESWMAAFKLGVLRALIREEDQPLPGGGHHGDLPDGWTKSLTHEVALALAMPPQSADKLMWTAWELEARLPETGTLLAQGALTYPKARAVQEALAPLTDDDAAKAEAMIAPDVPGKTYGQVEKLAVQAALTVDPESATRRREDAERNRARVALRRDPSGAASLSGYDLPPDETLAAYANVCARAVEYQESAAFPGVRMDQLRALAYLDLMNGVTAETRIAAGQPSAGLGASAEYGPGSDEPDASPDSDDPDSDDPDSGDSDPSGPDDDPDSDLPGPGGPVGGGSPTSPAPPAPFLRRPPRPADLIIPLRTVLGLAERPGESHGFGFLDPGLCRALAATAVNSPLTTLCVTVTDPDGIPIGHGCARPDRASHPNRNSPEGGHSPPSALPATINLTIPASALPSLAGPPGARTRPWEFTRTADPGPPGGYGAWRLTLPNGGTRTLKLEPVPVFECDHRHQSHAYQPNDKLRHLVQVRDYECTFPTCSRHARESDFEHARPYDQGGPTCACNAGARSRACHQVKQSQGWHVSQPRPGWHQWVTPAGRVYLQGPKRYPS